MRVKSTKSEKPRAIPLSDSAVVALKIHRQAQEINRGLYGPDYRKKRNLVLCDPQGNYLKPESITAKACLIAQKAGIKGVGLHTPRRRHAQFTATRNHLRRFRDGEE